MIALLEKAGSSPLLVSGNDICGGPAAVPKGRGGVGGCLSSLSSSVAFKRGILSCFKHNAISYHKAKKLFRFNLPFQFDSTFQGL